MSNQEKGSLFKAIVEILWIPCAISCVPPIICALRGMYDGNLSGVSNFVSLAFAGVSILYATILPISGLMDFRFSKVVYSVILVGIVSYSAVQFYQGYNPPKEISYRYRVGNRAWDGTKSEAVGSGAASHHGGVREWIHKDVTRSLSTREEEDWRAKRHKKGEVALFFSWFIVWATVYNFWVSRESG